MIRQPSARATRSSSGSGLTATGWPTTRSIGRSDSESEYAYDSREIDPLGGGPLADGLGLALAIGERAIRLAGVDAVAHLRARPNAAVEDQHVRHQLGHLVRGGGHDEDLPASVLVLVGLAEDVRIHARQHAREHLVAEPLEVAHARAGNRVEDPAPERVAARVGGAAAAGT